MVMDTLNFFVVVVFLHLGCGFELLVSTEAEKTANEGKLLCKLYVPKLLQRTRSSALFWKK